MFNLQYTEYRSKSQWVNALSAGCSSSGRVIGWPECYVKCFSALTDISIYDILKLEYISGRYIKRYRHGRIYLKACVKFKFIYRTKTKGERKEKGKKGKRRDKGKEGKGRGKKGRRKGQGEGREKKEQGEGTRERKKKRLWLGFGCILTGTRRQNGLTGWQDRDGR